MFFIEDIADNPTTDPSTIYNSFILIAEGESGPLYAAKHIGTNKVVNIYTTTSSFFFLSFFVYKLPIGGHQKNT